MLFRSKHFYLMNAKYKEKEFIVALYSKMKNLSSAKGLMIYIQEVMQRFSVAMGLNALNHERLLNLSTISAIAHPLALRANITL